MAEESLHFPATDAARLEQHLPPPSLDEQRNHPFVTLTFATSLDSSLALAPGVRTALSGPQSKAMTHYLRSRHDAICVGVGTAVADNPGLNCRLAASLQPGGHQPRPIVIDPHARWDILEDAKVLQLVRQGRGLAPFVVTGVQTPDPVKKDILERHGGKYIVLRSDTEGANNNLERFSWASILRAVGDEGLRSIMIEGGGKIINSLLEAPSNELVDSVIVTIAPTWLGPGGVVVSPNRKSDPDGISNAAARLTEVSWYPLGEDVVLCGRLLRA